MSAYPSQALGRCLLRLSLVWLVALPPIARAETPQRILYLETTVNGRKVDHLVEFAERDGKLAIATGEMQALGLARGDAGAQTPYVELEKLPKVAYHYQESLQSVEIWAQDASGAYTQLEWMTPWRDVPLTPAASGGVLNYDVQHLVGSGNDITNGYFLGRVFGPWGLVTSDVEGVQGAGVSQFVRLSTAYTRADPDGLFRMTVGDLINSSLNWTRPIRLGGFQAGTDFSTRPDLVTFPLPTVSGSAAVPSTVDVLVNGVRQLSEAVPGGPFSISQLPVVSGTGEISIVVRDALGHESVQTIPFYAAQTLLREGLSSYSVEAGAIRENFGLQSDTYGPIAASGSYRLGLTNDVTAEGHAEAARDLYLAGGGAAVRLGGEWIGSGDLAATQRDARTGLMLSLAIQHVSDEWSFSASTQRASRGYFDLAALGGAPVLTASSRLAFGVQVGARDSFGIAATLSSGPYVTPVYLVTATYSKQIFDGWFGYITLFKNLKAAAESGFAIGMTVPLDSRQSASLTDNVQNRRSSVVAQAMQASIVPGDIGWDVRASSGSNAYGDFEAEYLSEIGKVSAEVEKAVGTSVGRVEARGAVVFLGDSVHLTDWVDDSFAVVATGAPDVGVRFENRDIGKTDRNGEVLVPTLRSFDVNLLEIDPLTLPVDASARVVSAQVRPSDHVGLLVQLPVSRDHAATVRFVDAAGHDLTAGSMARLNDGVTEAPLGYGGIAYFDDLSPENTVEIRTRNGLCHARFEFAATGDTVPQLGPIPCQ